MARTIPTECQLPAFAIGCRRTLVEALAEHGIGITMHPKSNGERSIVLHSIDTQDVIGPVEWLGYRPARDWSGWWLVWLLEGHFDEPASTAAV